MSGKPHNPNLMQKPKWKPIPRTFENRPELLKVPNVAAELYSDEYTIGKAVSAAVASARKHGHEVELAEMIAALDPDTEVI